MKIPEWARKTLGGKKDEILQRLAEREEFRREVENTRWYAMLCERLEQELRWCETELRYIGMDNFQRLQSYTRSIELLLTVVRPSKLGGHAGELLKERCEAKKEITVDEHMEIIFGRHE